MARKRMCRISADACLTQPTDATCCASMTSAVLKHVLFMQQQIPCPFDQLLSEVSAPMMTREGKVRRPTAGMRKAARLVAATQALHDELPAAFISVEAAMAAHTGTGPVAALLFGSSVASPRMVYLLHFRSSIDDNIDPAEAAASVRNTTRRLLRTLATQCAQLSSIDPGCSRFHLLLQAPRGTPLSAAAFQPRPGLALKLRRAHVASVECSRPPSNPAEGAVERMRIWAGAPMNGFLTDEPTSEQASGARDKRKRGVHREPRGSCFVFGDASTSPTLPPFGLAAMAATSDVEVRMGVSGAIRCWLRCCSAAASSTVDSLLRMLLLLLLAAAAVCDVVHTNVFLHPNWSAHSFTSGGALSAAQEVPQVFANEATHMSPDAACRRTATELIWFQSRALIKGFRTAL